MTSRKHLKNIRSAGNGPYALKETTSRAIMASSTQLVFDQMTAPVPETMDGSMFGNILFSHCEISDSCYKL
jgi:hypothetical protein